MFSKPEKEKGTESQALDALVERAFIAAIVFFLLGGAATWLMLRNRPDLFLSQSKQRRLQVGVTGAATIALFYASAHFTHGGFKFVSYVLMSWCAGFSLVWSTFPIWHHLVDEGRVTAAHLKRKITETALLVELMKDPKATPIATSLMTFNPLTLSMRQRIEHMIVVGATGQGKTTLLITLAVHAFLHRHPVVIIDPKGDHRDIEIMKSYARAAGRSDDEFHVFSLPNPTISAKYNPLAVGTPQQKVAKLMDGLSLHHEYYGAKAQEYLTVLLDVFEFLKKPVSLELLETALISKTFLATIQNELREMEESIAVEKLIGRLQAIRSIKAEDLAGLTAQISSFNSLEFGSVLSPSPEETQIRLSDVIQKGGIAYFQMAVTGYGAIARGVGKMIIQDLKVTASRLHSAQANFNLEFGACFIDEFGSFAVADFADFLKQVRSTNMGVHLFCQGVADLRAVSPEFESQVLGNTGTKIVLRTDVPDDAETWAQIAGTVDAFDSSYQVERIGPWTERTGRGTQNPSKKMKVEFDVFKELDRGQGVLIDKVNKTHDLISLWDSKSVNLDELRKSIQALSSSMKDDAQAALKSSSQTKKTLHPTPKASAPGSIDPLRRSSPSAPQKPVSTAASKHLNDWRNQKSPLRPQR